MEGLRRARPDLALTTDLIVGFPGETDADFRATLALVRAAGFVDAYSFKYSPRPGTAAPDLGSPVPPEVAGERFEELLALLRALTLEHHRGRVGTTTSVLIEGESRRGQQASGRDPWHRVVNLVPGPGPAPRRRRAGRSADRRGHAAFADRRSLPLTSEASAPAANGALAAELPAPCR